MSPELISIYVLVAMFVIASWLPVNLGVLALAAAYLVGGLVGGLSPDDIFGGFPSKLFVLLVGVTYLFAIAQTNGTVEWMIDRGVGLVRGRLAFIPWLMYGLTALLAAMGALAAAALACVAPIALRFAARHSINPLMMGIMICLGSVGGSFSPISPFGVITDGVLAEAGLPRSPGLLFINNLAFSAAVAVVVFLVLGGGGLWKRGKVGAGAADPIEEGPDHGGSSGPSAGSSPGTVGLGPAAAVTASPQRVGSRAPSARINRSQALTLTGILALVVGALVFGLDVGLLAIVISVPLTLFATDRAAEAVQKVPWSVVLLIGGMLTYVGVLEHVGTLDYVGNLINQSGRPLFAALALCFVGALISAFAATAGVLAATIPLAVPVLMTHDLSVIGTVTALAIASTLVDSSPMSTNGALLLANQQTLPERVFFRRLLLWAVLTVVAGPPLVWLVFVVPGG
ncbi:SLC13 family permease [Pseudonocardia kunmingensis]|uniref:UIT1 family transporter n=1 Tax=Pseudonocardia kunmingensis TaxID=630975 RepID=A0A543DQI0_9PSEU|nr:SLC13 family permease [Pseudonocardia kunmingensis]TQM11591.1 UIT1 family transporter [Pseudonocardia kunmingensis]